MAERLCDICGNSTGSALKKCPFCLSEIKSESNSEKKTARKHKIINLEQGRPMVEQAIGKMENELKTLGREGVTSITFIHGYGSSGKGGVIKEECRKILDYLKSLGKIKDYVPGESFSSKEKRIRHLLKQCPELLGNSSLNKNNKGVTIVLL